MTYPPQPGQPDWQAQQGNQPPSPYGQYPGQYGGQGFPGQEFPGQGFQGQGYPGDPGQPPYGGPDGQPPKKKTGLIVGAAAGAVVVLFGVFALLAWVTPGFLLDDDDESSAAGSDPTPPQPPQSQVVPDPNASRVVPDDIEDDLDDRGDSGTGAENADAVAMAEDFTSAINSGDRDGATGLACSRMEDSVADNVDRMVDADAQLEIDSTTDTTYVVSARLSGSANGQDGTALLMLRYETGDDAWCVYSAHAMGLGYHGR
ncbi:hypothetical protein [Saccharomonospora sp. CUA-673]|uniref:hypothetical protein n=1 Tax=Saccharomonospora sp. CUA-673 TaxID=1904969 RepID=UPI001C9E891B|nr:hypothetical protein [Saccharomonospora sp. CUA-673]